MYIRLVVCAARNVSVQSYRSKVRTMSEILKILIFIKCRTDVAPCRTNVAPQRHWLYSKMRSKIENPRHWKSKLTSCCWETAVRSSISPPPIDVQLTKSSHCFLSRSTNCYRFEGVGVASASGNVELKSFGINPRHTKKSILCVLSSLSCAFSSAASILRVFRN